jgi:hypothetical protein
MSICCALPVLAQISNIQPPVSFTLHIMYSIGYHTPIVPTVRIYANLIRSSSLVLKFYLYIQLEMLE